MWKTREDYGHNTPWRAGTRNVIIQHQVLAFLPEECDMNGGKMTTQMCMAFARQYLRENYPEYEAALTLHNEPCGDCAGRYAVHIAINRTNLETGRRSHDYTRNVMEFKKEMAARCRSLDERWGLSQIEPGRPNSQIHSRQPGKVEKEMKARSVKSYKDNLRGLLVVARDRSNNIDQFLAQLEKWGVETREDKKTGQIYVTDTDFPKYSFNTWKLDPACSIEGLKAEFARPQHDRDAEILARDLQWQEEEEAKKEAEIKKAGKEYEHRLKQHLRKYAEVAKKHEGTPYVRFPVLKLPKIPDVLNDGITYKAMLLEYANEGRKLRLKYAGARPVKAQGSSYSGGSWSGGSTSSLDQPQRNRGVGER